MPWVREGTGKAPSPRPSLFLVDLSHSAPAAEPGRGPGLPLLGPLCSDHCWWVLQSRPPWEQAARRQTEPGGAVLGRPKRATREPPRPGLCSPRRAWRARDHRPVAGAKATLSSARESRALSRPRLALTLCSALGLGPVPALSLLWVRASC